MMKFKQVLVLCFATATMIGCSSDDSSGPALSDCEKPTDLIAINITTTSADLAWTDNAAATNWDIELGTAGFEPTGTPTAADVANPYTATGLAPGTDYEFYVRADCGDGLSDWAGPAAFTTSEAKNYFPLAEGNSWTYANKKTPEGEPTVESEETMTVAGSREENGNTYYEMNTDNPDGGLTTGILSSGELTKINGEMIFSGNYSITVPGFDPIVLPIDAMTVFSSTAEAGMELDSYSGTTEHVIEIGGQTLPLTINYTLTTTNEAFLPTYTVGEQQYENVLQANLSVSASISTTIAPLPPIDLLTEQEVVTVANYFANNVGMIYSDVDRDYDFADLSDFGVTIPDIHETTSQELSVYTVN